MRSLPVISRHAAGTWLSMQLLYSGLRLNSALSNYIQTSPLVRDHLIVKHLGRPTERQLISMEGSFGRLLESLVLQNAKVNRLREVRKLEEAHVVTLVTVRRTPDQVDLFLQCGEEISRKNISVQSIGHGYLAPFNGDGEKAAMDGL